MGLPKVPGRPVPHSAACRPPVQRHARPSQWAVNIALATEGIESDPSVPPPASSRRAGCLVDEGHRAPGLQHIDNRLYADEAWATIIDEFVSRVDLGHWETRMSGFVCSSQGARESTLGRLEEVGVWLNGRIFPDTYPNLRRSLETFQDVSSDLLTVFSQHADQAFVSEDPWIRSDRYYKRPYPNPNYHRDLTAFEKHFNLVNDLALELCRVANWLCDEVRLSIDPMFMTARGAMQVEGGPYEDGLTRWLRPEYGAEDISDGAPYPGLGTFATVVRYERDIHSKLVI